MPYIGKHLSVVDACEIMLEYLDEMLDISNAEIPAETNAEPVIPVRKRREVARMQKHMRSFMPVFHIPEFHIAEYLRNMIPVRNIWECVST